MFRLQVRSLEKTASILMSIVLLLTAVLADVAPASALKGVPPGSQGVVIVDSTDADTDGDTAIVKATYIEYGLYKNGCFGTQKIPEADLNGMYGLHGMYVDSIDTFGFAFDIGKDGWDVGTPYAHTGDLFMPGGPFEMWGITFTLNGTNYAAGCDQGGVNITNGNLPVFHADSSFTKVAQSDTKIEESSLAAYPGAYVVKQTSNLSLTTSGGIKADAVKIEQYFVVDPAGTRITMLLNVINNSGDPMTNLNYLRGVDPDPTLDFNPDGYEYTSLNKISMQGPAYAEVRAFGGPTSSDPFFGVGIALGAIDPLAVAHNSFDPWNIDPTFIPANPVALGAEIWIDNAMAVQIPRGSVSSGSTSTFESYYELDVAALPQPAVAKGTVDITKITGCTGPTIGGSQVTLFGKNFTTKDDIRIGGTKASCTYVNNTKVVCDMPPARRTGPATLIIRNDNGTDSWKGCTYTNSTIPGTGFPKGQISTLPKQPDSSKYASTNIKLSIPSLKVSAEIVGVPTKDNSWDVTWLGKQAGYLAGSAFPTWQGNSVLTGHVWNADNTPGIFANLKSLKYGDTFTVQAYGSTYTYAVRESLSVKEWDSASLMKHYEGNSWITLVTCEDYNPNSKTYANRRLVRAVLVSVD